MKKQMSEEYQEFDAADYVKTDVDVRELLIAAANEDPGDRTVIQAVLKHVAKHIT